MTFCVSEGTDRSEGRRRALGSLDEDDPNILLAIQLSLQESRRERGLEVGLELDGGEERRPCPGGDLAEVALHSLNAEDPPGARGFPIPLLDPPRPPNRTDSSSQPSISGSLTLPPPPPSLSAELLELGDSLMKLGNITTPYDVDTRRTYSHSALTAPYTEPAYSDCSHRHDQNGRTSPYVLEHITDQSCCHSSAYSSEPEHTASCALERTQNLSHPSSYNREHASGCEGAPKPDCAYHPCSERSSSYTAERPATYALQHPPRSEPRPPVQLCLPSPELEPELLLSPVIPPGGPFTPSDPQSLETLDPTASAQLLDNIMAWFNNNINPQNNPQNLALIPSPPTTETDSSPDTHTETEAESHTSRDVTPALIWQPLEGEPEEDPGAVSTPPSAAGAEDPESSLEVGSRDTGEEDVGAGCVADLSLDEVHTHPCPTETDVDSVLQLEEDRSPEEWEEQEHLV